jgi:hypothetical protein
MGMEHKERNGVVQIDLPPLIDDAHLSAIGVQFFKTGALFLFGNVSTRINFLTFFFFSQKSSRLTLSFAPPPLHFQIVLAIENFKRNDPVNLAFFHLKFQKT